MIDDEGRRRACNKCVFWTAFKTKRPLRTRGGRPFTLGDCSNDHEPKLATMGSDWCFHFKSKELDVDANCGEAQNDDVTIHDDGKGGTVAYNAKTDTLTICSGGHCAVRTVSGWLDLAWPPEARKPTPQ